MALNKEYETVTSNSGFDLPAGASFDEDGGDLVVRDSGDNIILRYDEGSAEWQFQSETITGAGSLSTEEVNNVVWKATDDDFQTKIDDAGSGGVVVLAPGDHGEPPSKIVLPSSNGEGVSIIGQGKGTKVKCLQNDWTIEGSTSDSTDTDNNVSGHLIKDVFFYQDSWANHGQGAIHFDRAIQSRVEGCWFKRLLYGIKHEATTSEGWANKYINNDFEIVQRPIWIEDDHDFSVINNHMEGISNAASIASFDDAEGPATGIGIIGTNVMQATVVGNNIEAMQDDGGEGKGIYVRNAANDNYFADNNVVGGTDRDIVIEYSSDPISNDAQLQFNNNRGDIANQGISNWSAPNTTLTLQMSSHRGRFDDVAGTLDEFHLTLTDYQNRGSDMEIGPMTTNDGAIIINGLTQQNATNYDHTLFIKGGTYSDMKLSDVIVRYLIIEDGISVANLTLSVLTLTTGNIRLRDSNTTVTSASVNGCLQESNSEGELVDVQTGATVTDITVQGCITKNSALVTEGGTITNLSTVGNIVSGSEDIDFHPSNTFSLSNVTTDRVLDADSTSDAELADVLSTLIQDLGMDD